MSSELEYYITKKNNNNKITTLMYVLHKKHSNFHWSQGNFATDEAGLVL